MHSPINSLAQHIAEDLAGEAPPGLDPLVARIRERCGRSLRAVVLYGSTRRNADIRDGLVDLMAIVSDYRSVHGAGLTAFANYLLPPNVYYLEAGQEAGLGTDRETEQKTEQEPARVRCKYIIVSERSFRARTAGGLDGYFWARFTQPCRLVWSADDSAADLVANARAAAATHFAGEARYLGNGELDARDFWIRAVSATYGCELRPEPPGAAAGLVDRDRGFWRGLSSRLLHKLDGVTPVGDDKFRIALSAPRRLAGRVRWAFRRLWNKLLNVFRLLKAAGTFANGVDYLSWKIERHSGVRVEVTDRMRRHPRVASWKLLFRMWRSGALR